MLVFVVDLARRHQIQPGSFCSAILGPKHFRSDTSETAMAKSLLIPAMLTGAAAFVAPTANLRATAAPEAGAAPAAATATSTGARAAAAAALLGCGVVAATRRPVRRTPKATTVAMRAENPRVEKLRTMEKTVQVGDLKGHLDDLDDLGWTPD